MAIEKSELWASLSETLFSNIDEQFINDFRKPNGPNNRLAAWGPFDSTARYFKFLLQHVVSKQQDIFFEQYRKLNNTEIGHPMTITARGVNIDIDYFLSINEHLFLEMTGITGDISRVAEIGAGFGRTCHGLISLIPSLDSYTIIDLPEVLQLSQAFLKRAVPEHFEKISFLSAFGDEWKQLDVDLVINIDSFQEMPAETIHSYLDFVNRNAKYFYCKNPICKYTPESVGISVKDATVFHDVFKLGLCTDVIDIFDETALIRCRETYLEKYNPGGNWSLSSSSPLEIFPYLQHALYCRN